MLLYIYMSTDQVSAHAKVLFDTLLAEGIFSILEHCDEHKCVDIFIPEIKLFIEVDGLSHFIDPEQIMTDFERDHYSDDSGFNTMRIPNILIENHLSSIVSAIRKVVSRERTLKKVGGQLA